MKNYFKLLVPALFMLTISCTDDGDTELPGVIVRPIYSEDFDGVPAFNFENWTNFAEAGSKTWFLNSFSGNNYVEFSSFGSGDSSNIGWLVSPAINIDEAAKKRVTFQSAQHHATNAGNTLDLLVSTDFDGTNVTTAHWTVLPFNKPQYTSATNYDLVNSGGINLSAYSGTIYLAFRVVGNGLTNSDFDGGFEIDNVKVF